MCSIQVSVPIENSKQATGPNDTSKRANQKERCTCDQSKLVREVVGLVSVCEGKEFFPYNIFANVQYMQIEPRGRYLDRICSGPSLSPSWSRGHFMCGRQGGKNGPPASFSYINVSRLM